MTRVYVTVTEANTEGTVWLNTGTFTIPKVEVFVNYLQAFVDNMKFRWGVR